MRSSRVLLSVLAAIAAPCLYAQLPLPGAPPASPLVAAQGDALRAVAPGSSVSLSVLVRTAAGQPLAGATVLFIAPASGASGLFAGKEFGSATTDAGGAASATLITNSTPGVFLVSAVVNGTSGAATFAIANGPAVAAPALSANDARTQVRSRLLNNAQENENLHLHGPVLLPAGSQVLAAGPTPAYLQTEPVITDRSYWLFWIDDAPLAGFSHPVRWVLVDSTDNTGNAAANARVVRQVWWPNVILPGNAAVHSLAPPVAPALSSSGAILANDELLRLLAPGPRPADAPNDACAIIIHGPNLGGAPQDVATFRDFLQNNNLVPPGNILLNLPLVNGTPSAAPQPTRVSDLQRLIDEAVKRGCKKLYFVLSTHGADNASSGGGGGVALTPEPSNPSGFLSYEKMMDMFGPLKGVELNIVLQSCYSGQIIPWLQGRGFTGQVITNADSNNISWFYTTMGGMLGFPLRSALKAPQADADNNGTVTFTEAFNFLKTSTTLDPKALVSKPQSSPISPTGPRYANGGYYYLQNPGSYFLFVPRPISADPNSTLTVTLTSRDVTLVDFGRASTTVVFPPGVMILPVPMQAYEPGETTFDFETVDPSTGLTYRGMGFFQIGDFTLTPDPLRVLVGETKPVQFKRFGPSVRLGQQVGPTPAGSGFDTATTLQIQSLNPDIAVPTLASIPVAHGIDTASIQIQGKKEGTAEIEVTEARSGTKVRFTVYVSAPPPPVFCPENATFNINFLATFDPSGHYVPIGLSDGTVIWIRTGNTFSLTGNKPQIVNITGTVDPATCMFSGMAFSPNPIAGFNNARAEIMNGSIGPLPPLPAVETRSARAASYDTISYQYRLGTNGVFPGGNPIYYSATGKLQSPSSCTFTVAPTTQAVTSAGISATATVSTTGGCPWTVTSPVPWITILTDASGNGNGTVRYKVDANSGAARTAALTIAGKTLTVNQSALATGAPVITGVINGASLQTGVAASAWVTIKGTNLSSTTRIWTGADFVGANLPTQLDGVSVKVGGKSGFVYYISPTQINFLAPDDVPLGTAQVEVTTSVGTSNPWAITNESTAPALFQFDPAGHIYVASVHLDGSLVAKNGLFTGLTTKAAAPLEDILLYGTGFGLTSPATPAATIPSAASPLTIPVAVRIGGQNAFVRFAGKVSPGLYQFNVVVPALPDGDYDVVLYLNGQPSARGATITIKR